MSTLIQEFQQYENSNLWDSLFHKLNAAESNNPGSYSAAKRSENRAKNRYRNVLPYDHSRITLKDGEDYINANIVEVPSVHRRYILTQGPLPETVVHFWQMMWEQNSNSIVMLNRLLEQHKPKCAKYYPMDEQCATDDDDFSVTFESEDKSSGFTVKYKSEEVEQYYTIRRLELLNHKTNEVRDINHYHYTAWPDFGAPVTPTDFTDFLWAIRREASLDQPEPCVIHCSAGIGRSGTFILVDACLKLLELNGELSSVSVLQVLADMRQYRSGLVQAPEQLRFAYLAIIEGYNRLFGDEINDFEPNESDGDDTNRRNVDMEASSDDDYGSSEENDALNALRNSSDTIKEESDRPGERLRLRSASRIQRERQERQERIKSKVSEIRAKQRDAENNQWWSQWWVPLLGVAGFAVVSFLGYRYYTSK